jgi:hypothetical protein
MGLTNRYRAALSTRTAATEVEGITKRIRKSLDKIDKFAKGAGEGWKANARHEVSNRLNDDIRDLKTALKGKS